MSSTKRRGIGLTAACCGLILITSNVEAADTWTDMARVTRVKAVNSGGIYVWLEDTSGTQMDPCVNDNSGNTRDYAFASDNSGSRNVMSALTAALLSGRSVRLRATAAGSGNVSCTFDQVELY